MAEHGPESFPEADPADSTYVSHNQASTVEDTIDDRLTRLEENIVDEQILRERLDKKLNKKLVTTTSRYMRSLTITVSRYVRKSLPGLETV